jgi:hypothetical protein
MTYSGLWLNVNNSASQSESGGIGTFWKKLFLNAGDDIRQTHKNYKSQGWKSVLQSIFSELTLQ